MTTEAITYPAGTMSTHRVEALSDGVFAIVMTILVFEITIPDVAPVELLAALIALWPTYIAYAISFVLLGIYWLGHRTQFNHILRADQNLHWLNIMFFAFCALVPFTTGLISRYTTSYVAIVVYGLNLICIGVSLYLHWRYASRHPVLTDANLSPALIRYGVQRCLLAPAGYATGILLGVINPLISLIVFALVPILYIHPDLTRRWYNLTHRNHQAP